MRESMFSFGLIYAVIGALFMIASFFLKSEKEPEINGLQVSDTDSSRMVFYDTTNSRWVDYDIKAVDEYIKNADARNKEIADWLKSVEKDQEKLQNILDELKNKH